MHPLSVTELAIRVGCALLCGALVGIERERKQRPAGFRTMILISIGSCGFVLIGIETINSIGETYARTLPPGAPLPGQAEFSRVLQGLIGGIGFLGAGAVIQNKKAVRGLTTAAAVWVVSALGAACGFGFYALAGILAGATLFTLIILDVFENRFFPDPNDGHGWVRLPKAGKNGADEVDAGLGPARMRGEAPDDLDDPRHSDQFPVRERIRN